MDVQQINNLNLDISYFVEIICLATNFYSGKNLFILAFKFEYFPM